MSKISLYWTLYSIKSYTVSTRLLIYTNSCDTLRKITCSKIQKHFLFQYVHFNKIVYLKISLQQVFFVQPIYNLQ